MPDALAEAKYYLFPLQVEFGVKCGADATVHDVQSFIGKYGDDPKFILLGAGAENAFSRTSREVMLHQTAQHSPSLIWMANALYAKGQTYMLLGDEMIRNREGTQQGDPESGLLFTLAIHPIVRKIESV